MALVTQPMKSRTSGRALSSHRRGSRIRVADNNHCSHVDGREHGSCGLEPQSFPPQHAQRVGDGNDHARHPRRSEPLPPRRSLTGLRPHVCCPDRNRRQPDENSTASGIPAEDHPRRSGRLHHFRPRRSDRCPAELLQPGNTPIPNAANESVETGSQPGRHPIGQQREQPLIRLRPRLGDQPRDQAHPGRSTFSRRNHATAWSNTAGERSVRVFVRAARKPVNSPSTTGSDVRR